MKINVVAVGLLKDGPEFDLIQKYLRRLQWKVEIKQAVVKKNFQGIELKRAEADLLSNFFLPNAPLIALDERGENFTSHQFAEKIKKIQLLRSSELNFCIGGAEGLCESIRQRASLLMSFGAMTWPHLMIRAMLIEQLYRAQQIILGHPYHKA